MVFLFRWCCIVWYVVWSVSLFSLLGTDPQLHSSEGVVKKVDKNEEVQSKQSTTGKELHETR